MSVCPNQELVERYVKGDCSADEQLMVETHLTGCPDCREQVEVTRSYITDSAQAGSASAEKDTAEDVPKEISLEQDNPSFS